MRTSHLAAVTIGLVLLGAVSLILGVWLGVSIVLLVLLVVSVFWIDRLVDRFYPSSWLSTTHIRGEVWIARALRAGAVLLFASLFALNGFHLRFLIAGVIVGAFGEFSGRVFSRREQGGPPAAQ